MHSKKDITTSSIPLLLSDIQDYRKEEAKHRAYLYILYLLFSVIDTEWSYNSYQETYSLPWTCESCNVIACLSPLERIQHTKFTCSSKTLEVLPETSTAPKDNRPNAKEYKCEICDQNLSMTPVEILRHKKSCKGK